MKKLLSIFVFCVLVLSACSYQTNIEHKDKLNIVTTIFPQYDLVRKVCADKANVTMLLSPGVDAHSFEPSPSDILKIQDADIFIYTGGQSDSWINTIMDGVSSDCIFLSLIDKVPQLLKADAEHEHEHSHEEEYDEHIWTSPKNAMLLSQVITDEICKADPGNEELYRANLTQHLSGLSALDATIAEIVANSKRQTLVFGDRFPFLYFAKEYSLGYHAAFPGCSSEAEPSAAKVAQLIDFVNSEKIPVIFTVELSNQKIANTIADATDAEILLMHSCHNISKQEFEGGITYLELMQQNAENLKKALN